MGRLHDQLLSLGNNKLLPEMEPEIKGQAEETVRDPSEFTRVFLMMALLPSSTEHVAWDEFPNRNRKKIEQIGAEILASF